MEHILIDYLTNATWQIPLLAGGAWLFIRIGKFGPRAQHCVWLTVLALAVGLPLRGVRPDLPLVNRATCANCSVDGTPSDGREALPPAAIVTQFVVADPRLSKELFTLPRPTLRLSPVATDWLIGIYFAVLFFGFYRILVAWRRARQLVADADPATLPPQWNAIFEDSGRRLSVKLPQLRKSADVRSPVIVGVMHPVLLLPEGFANHSQNEVQAVLFHELAHVRRHDYLSNLLCRLAALPVAWHPLTFRVQQRIRRTREMVCDDIAAWAMQSEIGYAKCLLAMAGRTLRQHDLADAAQAIGLFGDNVLEERIMRLMQGKSTMTIQAKLARGTIGAIAMVIAIAMAASFHVTPTLAQTTGTVVTAHAPPASPAPDTSVAPAAPDASASPAIHEVPAAPPAPDASASPVVPPAPVPPVTLAEPNPPAVAPVPPVAPEPAEVKSSPRKKKVVGHHPKKANDKSIVIDSNGVHTLTAQQQEQLNKQMAAMDAQIAEATKRFSSPEFKQQMADIAKQQADFVNRQVAEETKRFSSPEFKQQMAEIAKQQADLKHLDFAQMQRQIDAATAKVNSPEFKQKMENLQKQIESGAMQRSMEEASKQMKLAEEQQNAIQKLDMARMQQQIDAATAKINSPEFQQKMENLQKQLESGAMQRSMEEARKQLKAAEDRMRQAQTK